MDTNNLRTKAEEIRQKAVDDIKHEEFLDFDLADYIEKQLRQVAIDELEKAAAFAEERAGMIEKSGDPYEASLKSGLIAAYKHAATEYRARANSLKDAT